MVVRVFVAGGSGALGRRLVPQLVARGHQVTATSTGPAKLGLLEQLGADGVVMDGLDAVSVGAAVATARPDAIVHQMTAISAAHAGKPDLKHPDRFFATTIRLRSEGTDHLLAAAEATGEAEDAVQETWLRYESSSTQPTSTKAFLSAAATRSPGSQSTSCGRPVYDGRSTSGSGSLNRCSPTPTRTRSGRRSWPTRCRWRPCCCSSGPQHLGARHTRRSDSDDPLGDQPRQARALGSGGRCLGGRPRSEPGSPPHRLTGRADCASRGRPASEGAPLKHRSLGSERGLATPSPDGRGREIPVPR